MLFIQASYIIPLCRKNRAPVGVLSEPVDTETQRSLLSLSPTHQSELHQVHLISRDEDTDDDIDILNDSSSDHSEMSDHHSASDGSLSDEDNRYGVCVIMLKLL